MSLEKFSDLHLGHTRILRKRESESRPWSRELLTPALTRPECNLALPKQTLVLPEQTLVLPKQTLVLPKQTLVLPKQTLVLVDEDD